MSLPRPRAITFFPPLLLLALVPDAGIAQGAGVGSAQLQLSSQREEARAAFHAGLHHSQHLTMVQAAEEFGKALDLDPGFGLARAFRARTLAGPDRRVELERAVRDGAGASAGELLLILAWREQAGNRPQAARALLRTAVELHPDDPRIAVEHAWALAAADRPQALRQVVERHPEYAPAHLHLAFALTPSAFEPIREEDGREALAAAREAVRLGPGEPGTHAILGHVLHRVGRDEEAVTHLGHATAASPTPNYAYQVLAEIAIQNDRPREAREALEAAIRNSANQEWRLQYRLWAGLMHAHEGAVEAATRDFQAAADGAEANGSPQTAAYAHRVAATLLSAAGEEYRRQVNFHLDEAWRLDPRAFPHDDWATAAYALSGQVELARRSRDRYAEATAGFPGPGRDQTIHRLTGLVLLAEGEFRSAIDEFERGGANPVAQLGLIEAHRALGDHQAANAIRDRLLETGRFGLGSVAAPMVKLRHPE